MKLLRFLFLGVFFGIIMTKSEAVSWFRIQEMFRFESFHMYGIIGTAVILGAAMIFIMKKTGLTTMEGKPLKLQAKEMQVPRLLIGGTIFGLGWAMTGACPGPLYVLVGHGAWAILVVIASALLGALVYGALRSKLPH